MKIIATNLNFKNKTVFCAANKDQKIHVKFSSPSSPSYDSFSYIHDTDLQIPKGVLDLHNKKVREERGKATSPVYDAFHDQLTSLRTKEYLLCRLPQIISKAKEAGNEIQIAMFDMDNFKSINEVLGYETGDAFLKTIARSIKEVSGENGLGAYRFGGEEFVIVFKNTPRKKNIEITNEILAQIKNNKTLSAYSETYLRKCRKRLKVLNDQNKIFNEIERTKAISSFLEEYIQELSKNPFGCDNEPTHLYYKLDEINASFLKNFTKLITQKLSESDDEKIRAELEKTLNDCHETLELQKKNELLKIQLASSSASLSIDTIKRIYGSGDNYCQYIKQDDDSSFNSKELVDEIFKTQKRINQKCDNIKENKFLNKYFESLNHKLEIAQLEKWIDHFDKENGFTLTCGIKTFENSTLGSQSPISMVNEAGEILKRGKNTRKGKVYCDKI